MALVIRMDGGELATRVTAWIALAGWTAAVALLKNAGAEKAGRKARKEPSMKSVFTTFPREPYTIIR